jgi:NitT/TauT family transport system substrate-binding protein
MGNMDEFNSDARAGALDPSRRRFLSSSVKVVAAVPLLGAGFAQLLAACGTSTPGTTTSAASVPTVTSSGEPLRYGHLPYVNFLVPYGTADQGPGFQLDFGFPVELIEFTSGPALAEAMAAGEVDVGELGLTVNMNAALNGLPIQSLMCTNAHARGFDPFTALTVSNDSDIQEFTDLEGKTVAVLSFGGFPDLEVGQMEFHYGLSRNSFDLVALPYPDMEEALRDGQIDAALNAEPFLSRSLASGDMRVLASTLDVMPHMGLDSIMAHNDAVRDRPDDIVNLMAQAIRTCRWIMDNQDDARSVAQDNFNLPDDVASRLGLGYWLRNGEFPIRSILSQLRTLDRLGLVRDYPDEDEYLERWFIEPSNRFLSEVLEIVGEEEDEVADGFENDPLPEL